MPTIRLIREVTEPGNRGPSRGMYALQQILRENAPKWLQIGGKLKNGEIPWVWCWKDARLACQFAEWQWPFVLGPNVFFQSAAHPGRTLAERTLLDAESCKLQFTESAWYRDLILANCNHNESPIVLWPYPICPIPDGPTDPYWDLLIYVKDQSQGKTVLRAQGEFPRSNVILYGHYAREELIYCARQSRCCLYLSSDDRGPLALAEIMLCGCPAVGVMHGAPWIHPCSGVMIGNWMEANHAIREAMTMDRTLVSRWAKRFFDPLRTRDIILNALRPLADG